MKIYLFLVLVLIGTESFSQHPTAGNYNIYYGNLHNHTTFSDGSGTVDIAYTTARQNGLDFFSVADHCYSLTTDEYSQIVSTANNHNQEGKFVTFYGFEWSSNTYGHIAVINAPKFTKAGNPATGTFTKLMDWLYQYDCIAFLNHPGREGNQSFNRFQDPVNKKVVGMELWNKATGFESYYYNDGFFNNDGQLGYWEEGIAKGWKLGASGAEDHHNTKWGSNRRQVGVLAKSLTRDSIYLALKSRRFFSTEDKTISLSFKMNGKEMGSTVLGGSENDIRIEASNADGQTFKKVEVYKDGILFQNYNVSSSTVNITDTFSISNGEFYYVKITQSDGHEAISSPIWVDIPPVTYNLESTTDGNGSVSMSPIVGTYEQGTEVTLSAQANPGYQFDYWSGAISDTINPVTITMDSNISVVAHFKFSNVLFATNCGGTAYSATTGTYYSDDTYFNGGNTFTKIETIANTQDDNLYHTERYGSSFSYNIPVTNGAYEVTLQFAEVWASSAGVRIFNVDIEGVRVLNNFDIYEQVGKYTAYDKTYNVIVEDSVLDIGFTSVADNAKISAIEVKAVKDETYYSIITNSSNGSIVLNPMGGTYTDGTMVTLTAAPNVGYDFTGWSGDLSGTTNPDTITMDSDKNITAVFTKITSTTDFYAKQKSDMQIYPNPFSTETIISYQLKVPGYVRISIHNLTGQKISVLVDKMQIAGVHKVNWEAKQNDGQTLPKGVYICHLETSNGLVRTAKMILSK